MAILDVKGLYKDFSGLEVINGIDFSLEPGVRHAVIGPNGAGKSTFFNLITGKYVPTRGRIQFKGRDITGWPTHRIVHLGLARSFQITNIFRTLTVFENLRNAIISKINLRHNFKSYLKGMRAITNQAEQILELIGLLERKDVIAGELDYGNQRALEIGLTVAMAPELILLDEPTAGMSAEETREAIKLIRKITEGKTLIIVEHDMEVVFSLADRITVIVYGTILASGPPEEIRQDQRVKDAYLGEERQEDD